MSTVLVTGSSGGIGTAICRELSSVGHTVVGVDKSKESNTLEKFIEYDLSNLLSGAGAIDEFLSRYNKVANGESLIGLVNNAAVQIVAPVEELSHESIRSVIDVNLVVPTMMCKLFWSNLYSGRGTIVNIGSIHGRLTKASFSAYAASKAGLVGLTRALAVEARGKVRVNLIELAAIQTSMLEAGFEGMPDRRAMLDQFHPSGRIGNPEEVASLVAFLMSEKCKFLNGEIIGLNGGIGSKLHDPSD